jgi:hypothetical protein
MFGECGRIAIPTAFGLLALLVVVTKIEAQPAPSYAALLATPDRSDADRQADKRRDRVSHPAMNKTKTAR